MIKKDLNTLREQLKEKLTDQDYAYSEILFLAYAHRSILTVINNDPEYNRSRFDPIEELHRWVLLALCYFVVIPRTNFIGSYSMVDAYYETYSLFDTTAILDILSNKGGLFYDSSHEALLAAALVLYENETGTTAEELIKNNIKI